MEIRLKLFFRPVLAGQSDPLFEPAKLLILTPRHSILILAQEFFFAKIQGTSRKAFTTRWSDSDLHWCRIPNNGWSRTVLHDKAHWRVLTIYRNSDMSWVHLAKWWNFYLNQKVGFGWTLGLDPYWKLQPAACKVNVEWKLEWGPWTRTILTRGLEFLMAWINWSRIWTTRTKTTKSRKPQKCSSKNMR